MDVFLRLWPALPDTVHLARLQGLLAKNLSTWQL